MESYYAAPFLGFEIRLVIFCRLSFAAKLIHVPSCSQIPLPSLSSVLEFLVLPSRGLKGFALSLNLRLVIQDSFAYSRPITSR